jgi:hypothetical protein
MDSIHHGDTESTEKENRGNKIYFLGRLAIHLLVILSEGPKARPKNL